jgi:flagellar protein FlbD
MVHLTRLRGTPLVVNADLIELVETTPDTVVTLVTGRKVVVEESAEEVMNRVLRYRAAVHGLMEQVALAREERDEPTGTDSTG